MNEETGLDRPQDVSATAGTAASGAVDDANWAATALGAPQTWPPALAHTQRLIAHAPMPMAMLVGRHGRLVYNDRFAALIGAAHPAALGRPVLEALPAEADMHQAALERAHAGQTFEHTDRRLVFDEDNRPRSAWFDVRFSPIVDEAGAVLGAWAVYNETTSRFLANRALRRTERRLSLALSASGVVGVWEWDPVERTLAVEGRLRTMMSDDAGKSGASWSIDRFVETAVPDDRDRLREKLLRTMEDEEPFSVEYRMRAADGKMHWILARGDIVADEQERTTRSLGIIVDITDEKRASDALRRSEDDFRTLADTMPQMVWSTRPDGFHDYYNARWYEFTGMPEGSTDGEEWNGMFHPDDRERAWQAWRHSLETGEAYEIEYRLRHHSGEYRWTLGRALPAYDENGRIRRWFGTCTDIHGTKLALEEREILTHELSHRIKNIFSVLSGIVSLSARAHPEARAFADQLRARIYSMGQAHELVRPHSAASRDKHGDTSLKALFEILLQPFWDESARIAISGDDIPVGDKAATPLALVVHELATNAAKYGALAEENGRLDIVLRHQGETVRILWTETAPTAAGAPSPRTGEARPAATGTSGAEPALAGGFGSRLISLSVEGQLDGEVHRTLTETGMHVEITVPAKLIAQSAALRASQKVMERR